MARGRGRARGRGQGSPRSSKAGATSAVEPNPAATLSGLPPELQRAIFSFLPNQYGIFACITLNKKLSYAAKAVIHRHVNFIDNYPGLSKFLRFIIGRPELWGEVVFLECGREEPQDDDAIGDHASNLLPLLLILPNIRTLHLSDVPATQVDAVFSAVGRLSHLITFQYAGLTDADEVGVYSCPTWAQIRAAIQTTQLTRLTLFSLTGSFQPVNQAGLQDLRLSNLQLSDDNLRSLVEASAVTLRCLIVYACDQMTAGALVLIGQLVPQLERLELASDTIPEEDIPPRFLAPFRNLKVLELDGTLVHGPALLAVSAPLETLRLLDGNLSAALLTASLVRICGLEARQPSKRLQLKLVEIGADWPESDWDSVVVRRLMKNRIELTRAPQTVCEEYGVDLIRTNDTAEDD
jgi:hypothetical protein